MRNMRQKFADQLLALLEEKPLGQITVTELSANTHVSRQTFYYYFSDVFEVAEYILHSESLRIMNGISSKDEESRLSGYGEFLSWLSEHPSFGENAMCYFKAENLRKIVDRLTEPIAEEVIKRDSDGLQVNKEQLEFVIHFYMSAVANVTMDWIRQGMKEDPQRIVENVYLTTRNTMDRSLESYDRYNRYGK